MNILQACADPQLFAPWLRDPKTWVAWTSFTAALFGLPMNAEQRAIYRKCTGRDDVPKEPSTEAWLICGRRAGKSFTMSLIAVFASTFRDYREYLQPGERATTALIAADRKQARICFRYIRGLLGVPMLRAMVENERADSFDLNNSVTIEVSTASVVAPRGYNFCAVICDEIAFFATSDLSPNQDSEVLSSIRPGLASIPGSLLLCASSPYARRGVLWQAHQKYFGKPGTPLCWVSDTRTMNPTISQRVVDEALVADPARASAEWLGIFRSDVESYIAREAVEACVSDGVFERPPISSVRYFAFIDPAGGSGGGDFMTLCIGHREKDRVVIDCLREKAPPFSPVVTLWEFAETLRSYRCYTVEGDRYAGEFAREPLRHHGVSYKVAEKSKSELYTDFLPALNSGQVDLLDHPKSINQICALERRTNRGHREIIDHPPHAHDDICNVIAGLVGLCRKSAVAVPAVQVGRAVYVR